MEKMLMRKARRMKIRHRTMRVEMRMKLKNKVRNNISFKMNKKTIKVNDQSITLF